MTTTELNPTDEAEILIEKFLSRDIDKEEGERLLSFLREHPAWEQEIYDQQHVVNLLKEVRELETSERDGSKDAFKSELMGELLNFYEKVSVYSRNMRRRRFRQRLLLGSSTTLSFFLMAIVVHAYWTGALTPGFVSQIKVSIPDPPTSDAVAVLAKTLDVEWGKESSVRAEPGAVLSPCGLNLEKGTALIRFYNGANLVIEGPASLEIRSISEVFCEHGRFSLEAPSHLIDFSLSSQAFASVSGEAFYLHIDPQAKTELHCVRNTTVSWHEADNGEKKSKTLSPNEGLLRKADGTVESLAGRPDRYISVDGLEKQAVKNADDQYRSWQQSRRLLQNDPSLVLFFDFQRDSLVRSDRIVNRAENALSPKEGILIGGSVGAGRWPEKDSLEFRTVSDRLLVSVADRLKSLSMSVSLRTDDIGRNLNSIFLTERFDDGPLHWQILNNIEGGERGAVRLGIKEPKPKNFKATNFDSPVVFDASRMGVWTRLAVVIDVENRIITHYMNGCVLNRHELPFDVDFGLLRSEIGNWSSDTPINPIRNFIGGFEEFLLFSRALSDAEIDQLHQCE